MKNKDNTHIDLEKILTPRDKNGLIQPMIRDGGTDLEGNPCYYPCLPQRPDGLIEPMIFEEDLCERPVTYHEGLYMKNLGVMSDGSTRLLDPSSIHFDNHLLNMPQFLHDLNTQTIPDSVLPAARQVADHLVSHGILSLPDPNSDDDEPDGLYISNLKGGRCRVCNHHISVKALRHIREGEHLKYEVELELTKRTIYGKKRTHVICVPEAELENLAGYLGAMLPSFALASETSRAAQLLAEYIRNQLDDVPRVTIFKTPGWAQHDGLHFFVHADTPAFNSTKFECAQTIIAEDLSPAAAFREALGILDIGRLQVLLPLMLTALAGPLFQLFADAGYTPRFCTYLFGLSGSLKTAVSLVFYRFFSGQKHSSFRDTPASIDVAVGEHHDQMLLVDDFQPAVVAADGTNMRKALEHLIRLYGDDVAKKRSNCRATATYGKAPRGSCLITGESLSGSYSSLLRCLLVPISRGDVDGQLLRRYQETPGLWCTNYVYLLPWVGRNWDRLVNRIRTEFPNWRHHFGAVTPEPRLADTGAVLTLIGEIFLAYGIDCGALTREYVQHALDEWRTVIETLLGTTTDASQELDVCELTRESINVALTDESLRVAPDLNSFTGRMDGFFNRDFLWLKPQALDRILQQYCATNQLSSVRGSKAVLPELYKRGLIVRDEESNKNSFLKRSPEIPALKRRLRMIVFRFDELFRET